VRLAGLLIGAEGLFIVGLAGYLLLNASSASLSLRAVLGQAGFVALLGAGVLVVAVGLVRGRFWARSPGIVIQALLIPAMFSLLGPSHQVLAGLVGVAVVITGLMLLLGGEARRWSEHQDELRR
jgi:hypothetical protein